MKIDTSSNINAVLHPTHQEGRVNYAPRRQIPHSQDNVDLTTQASTLQALERTLAQVPDTDVSKVERVKQAIAEGRFKVDVGIVAARLVEESIVAISHAPKRL